MSTVLAVASFLGLCVSGWAIPDDPGGPVGALFPRWVRLASESLRGIRSITRAMAAHTANEINFLAQVGKFLFAQDASSLTEAAMASSDPPDSEGCVVMPSAFRLGTQPCEKARCAWSQSAAGREESNTRQPEDQG